MNIFLKKRKAELASVIVQKGKAIQRYSDRMRHTNEFLPGNDFNLFAFISLKLYFSVAET